MEFGVHDGIKGEVKAEVKVEVEAKTCSTSTLTSASIVQSDQAPFIAAQVVSQDTE